MEITQIQVAAGKDGHMCIFGCWLILCSSLTHFLRIQALMFEDIFVLYCMHPRGVTVFYKNMHFNYM
jgi:hypothetical protein